MEHSDLVQQLHDAIEYEDDELFRDCVQRLSSDYNANIIEIESEETELNLLHFLSGSESTRFVLNCLRYVLELPEVNINRPAEIDGNFGITAAHLAVENHNPRALRLLVEHGCDLFRCDSFGRNIQDYAEREEASCPELITIINEGIEAWYEGCAASDQTAKKDDERHSPNDVTFTLFSDSSENENDIDDDILSPITSDGESPELQLFEDLDSLNSTEFHSISPVHEDNNNVTEVFLYKDASENVELLEERTLGSNVLIEEQLKFSQYTGSQGGSQGSSNNEQAESVINTSIETVIDDLILKMTNTQLFDHCRKSGFNPGPINDRTKKLYQRRASRALRDSAPVAVEVSNQQEQIVALLCDYPLVFDSLVQRRFPFKEAIEYEEMLVEQFSPDNASIQLSTKRASKKTDNTFFVYLLLDPEITDNLPERANFGFEMMLGGGGTPFLDSLDPRLFASFVLSVFYVGKGKNNRAYQHFYDAFKFNDSKGQMKKPLCRKTKKILDIWNKKKGPISLHCFNGISSEEAFAREYLMIETLGLPNLTNQISGNSKIRHKLNYRQRRILGTYLLYKAFIILLLNGERQIKRSSSHRF